MSSGQALKRTIPILLILSFLCTGCINPYCMDVQNHNVNNAVFEQCINKGTMVPGRMGIMPAAEIDACAAKAAEFNKKMCGM